MSTVTDIKTTWIDVLGFSFFNLKGPPGILGVQGPIGPRGQRGRPVSMLKIFSVGNQPNERIISAIFIMLNCSIANEEKKWT